MRLLPDLVHVEGRVQSGLAVDVADGRITAPTPAADARGATRLSGALLLPGTVNAHCHTSQSLLRGLGDDFDFMAWRDRVLYPYSTRLDREGIYLGAALLQKVRHLDGTRLPAETAFAMGTRGGAQLLGLDAGEIATGRLADLVAVDLAHPSLHPPSSLLKNVVYAMSPQAITDVWVHGRQVVAKQRLTTLDQETLMERVRRLTHGWTSA
jgi:cytosine/adenosine deaminase-related metal-dependent hydrolase